MKAGDSKGVRPDHKEGQVERQTHIRRRSNQG
jgi:hypothetical protein